MKWRIIVAVLPLIASCRSGDHHPAPRPSGNVSISSFSKAKRALAKIYGRDARSFYCGCAMSRDLKTPNFEACGYKPKMDNKRARRVEWEHVVPAHALGRSLAAWRDGHPDCVSRNGRSFKGRNCARKVSLEFRHMEADLYNLVPAIGEVNGLRSNYAMGMIPGELRKFGACDLEIADRKVEPRPEVRGDIARIYQYMAGAYPRRGIVSRKNRKLFEAWKQSDPVDTLECRRAQKIEDLQGNPNAVLQAACQKLRASR